MFIKLNVQNEEELQAVTVILVNRIIEGNETKITLDDPGIESVVSQLRDRLLDEQLSGNLVSMTGLDYSINDIITTARKLLNWQREQVQRKSRA